MWVGGTAPGVHGAAGFSAISVACPMKFCNAHGHGFSLDRKKCYAFKAQGVRASEWARIRVTK